MKFFAQPNLFIRINNKNLQRIVGKKGFYFDDKGEYETDNKYLIEALKIQFKFDEEVQVTTDDIMAVVEVNVVDEEVEVKKTYQCKQCDFVTENKGKYLAHTRTHKKEV